MSRVLVTGMSGAGKTTVLDVRRGATLELDGRRQPTELADIIESLVAPAP